MAISGRFSEDVLWREPRPCGGLRPLLASEANLPLADCRALAGRWGPWVGVPPGTPGAPTASGYPARLGPAGASDAPFVRMAAARWADDVLRQLLPGGAGPNAYPVPPLCATRVAAAIRAASLEARCVLLVDPDAPNAGRRYWLASLLTSAPDCGPLDGVLNLAVAYRALGLLAPAALACRFAEKWALRGVGPVAAAALPRALGDRSAFDAAEAREPLGHLLRSALACDGALRVFDPRPDAEEAPQTPREAPPAETGPEPGPAPADAPAGDQGPRDEALDLLEELLALTEPYRGMFLGAGRQAWGRISARCADLRERADGPAPEADARDLLERAAADIRRNLETLARGEEIHRMRYPDIPFPSHQYGRRDGLRQALERVEQALRADGPAG